MTYVCTSIYGKRREARLEPWLDPNGDLARLSDAAGVMWQGTLELAEEEGEDGTAGYIPAWGRLMDPVLCPNKGLAYLMQFLGIERMKEETEAEARATLKRDAHAEFGSLRSIEEAIKKVIGAAKFTIQERTAKGGTAAAYHFNVLLGAGLATTALTEAIRARTPAPVQFALIETTNTWLQGTKTWGAIAAGKKWTEMTEGNY